MRKEEERKIKNINTKHTSNKNKTKQNKKEHAYKIQRKKKL